MINKKIIAAILLFLIVADFSFGIVRQSWIYTRPYNHTLLSEIYSGSQYVLGNAAKRSIGDDGLYPFAGYYYITGGDPSQVNFENPTVGKYLIGFSAYVFGNENLIYIFYAALVLLITFTLSKLLFESTVLALSTTLLLEISPFFKIQFIPTNHEQLSIALLDLPLALFFTAGLYFFLKAKKQPLWYWVSSVLFALCFATKFFPSLVLFIVVLLLWQIKSKNRLVWIVSLFSIPIIYLLSYSAYFYYHPSLVEFLRYQKWIIDWRLGNPFVVGNIFRTIFTGSYVNWWDGGIVVDHEWTWSFAVIVITGLCGAITSLFKRKEGFALLATIVLVYIVYLSVNTVGVARYALLIYPLLCIFAVRFFTMVFAIMNQWNKTSKQ